MDSDEKARRGLRNLDETFKAEGRYKSMIAFLQRLNEMFPPNVEGIIVNEQLNQRMNDGISEMREFIEADLRFCKGIEEPADDE